MTATRIKNFAYNWQCQCALHNSLVGMAVATATQRHAIRSAARRGRVVRSIFEGHQPPLYRDYPASILWDGEYDPDPLTFLVGQNLETEEREYLTLTPKAPHILISGVTGSGKTSFAEIIAAQVLIKPMPWDPDLHGSVVVMDPQEIMSRRWAGRRGVLATHSPWGASASEDSTPTDPRKSITSAMASVEAEYQRRVAIMSQNKGATTWLDLPEAVKREERLAPMIVIMEEYLMLTEQRRGSDAITVQENHRCKVIADSAGWIASEGHDVGIHLMLIPHEVDEAVIGSSLMQNLPARVTTGSSTGSGLRAVFGDRPIPALSVSGERLRDGEGMTWAFTVPGRARIMRGPDEAIRTIQIPWFGGWGNSDALDKWLPRTSHQLAGVGQ